MTSSTTHSFRSRFRLLPTSVQHLARKNFKLWQEDPEHRSLRFKKVGRYWSARVGARYRALARIQGNHAEWFWIGPHDEYERLLKQ